MKSGLMFIADSPPVQFLINIIIYSFYAAVLGVSIAPSAAVILWGAGQFLTDLSPQYVIFADYLHTALRILFFALCCGAAFYIYMMWGTLFMGLLIRVLSIGIKPGLYPQVSMTMLRWIIYSGIFTIVMRTILPITVMSFFCKLFFRLLGCKIGKNVYINSPNLNDAKFLELEDGVVIGGAADITCHTFEGGKLLLGRIRIGKNSVIGARAYILPNVTIGERCSIGIDTIIRKNKVIPDKSMVGTTAGIPLRAVAKFEKEHWEE